MEFKNVSGLEWTVRVDCHGTMPQQFNAQDVSNFLYTHAGCTVLHATEQLEDGKKWIRLGFGDEDTQRKAVCMTGFPIGGATLEVTPLSKMSNSLTTKPKIRSFSKKRGPDTRRNLYVLNLPHDLPEQAYHDLFLPHGTPTHTVLLKTYDSCSRRRGFVVMSKHEEAQQVIKWLDGFCLRGFQLRVTWANIDRSNGFLSGYDRTNLSPMAESPTMLSPSISSTSITQRNPISSMDVHTIVASNIPSSVFPKTEIDILFKPFGHIQNIEVITPHSAPNHLLANLAPTSPIAQTAIVTYMNANDAIAAKNTLHGQVYEGFTLAVGFVSNLGKDDLISSKSASFKPLAPSTNSAAYNYDRMPFMPLAAPEHTFRGLPVAAYDPMPYQYSPTFPIATLPHDSWMPYSPSMPQAPFTYQLSYPTTQAPIYYGENYPPHDSFRPKQPVNSLVAYLTHQAVTRG
ncbi:hypothetical protein M422DRAFT_69735 [Sphaerobolus stellatus SS14]|uniref:Unplaced genomic scaffold SPHSTscaffold_104, whole genome shotgun sequence n=1 Tax=Sphaerobolus stellatus (strain SS14) TaxID=990650 RepID=A0A0C9V3K2_SPHS4|nr:hypothetical protein M422DRAFT_69735 [Sphaerobolus stellatus SS14]